MAGDLRETAPTREAGWSRPYGRMTRSGPTLCRYEETELADGRRSCCGAWVLKSNVREKKDQGKFSGKTLLGKA